MRVYHFLSTEHGLSDIALRRMRISRFSDLNDPFELLAANVGGRKDFRKALQNWKKSQNDTKGLLCFSKAWHDPVLWSHYAAKHYGFCLGFDLNEHLAQEVEYAPERILSKFNDEPAAAKLDRELVQTLHRTKYKHWRYEEEVRVLLNLYEHSSEGGSFFYEFSEDLILREVILGPLCDIPVERVWYMVQKLYKSVVVRKARLAFKFFKVVPDERFECHP